MAIDITVGGASANSYVEVAEVAAYIASHYVPTATETRWTALTTGQKEGALMRATQLLDRHVKWQGDIASDEQALSWPRAFALDRYGRDVPSSTIPTFLKEFQIETALWLADQSGVAPEIGNALQMKNMPLGTNIHNIEMQPGQGGKLVRSAGASAQLTNKEERYAVLKMPSGELRKVLINCYATVGIVSNSDHSLETMGKAGRNRWRGIKPRTRGVAMNPVDHPMGGGEGKSSGGHPRSRTGKYAKGLKTRQRGKGSDKLIIQTKKGKKLAK